MKACSDQKEKLMMDVCGELGPDERAELDSHLAECDACRAKKDRLVELFQSARREGKAPALTNGQAHAFSSDILRRLRTEKPDRRTGFRLAPAMAAAGLVLVFAGWLGLNSFRTSDKVADVSENVPDTQLVPENEELLENMEFFQEMDEIEKLVKLLDDSENGGVSDERESRADDIIVRV